MTDTTTSTETTSWIDDFIEQTSEPVENIGDSLIEIADNQGWT